MKQVTACKYSIVAWMPLLIWFRLVAQNTFLRELALFEFDFQKLNKFAGIYKREVDEFGNMQKEIGASHSQVKVFKINHLTSRGN